MVDVPIQHMIGTVALIGLVVSAGLFYTVFTSFVQDENRKKELEQISENVAMNLEEMINLVKFAKFSSNFSDYLVKIIDLPSDVGGKTYQIQLFNNSNQLGVHSFLATEQTLSADSAIPFNSGETPLLLNTSTTVYHIVVGVDNTKIACCGTIYGKKGTAIWAFPDWSNSIGNSPSTLTIGIGWIEALQS